MLNIKAIILYKIRDNEFRKICDILNVIKLKYQNEISLRIKYKRQNEYGKNIIVNFNKEDVINCVNKLDTYISIVDRLLDKNEGGNNATNI